MWLRRTIIISGLLMMLGGGVMMALGARAGGAFLMLANGALLFGGAVFEHYKYKNEVDNEPGPGWIRTDERMVQADHVITVWYHPKSGERMYVRSRPEGKRS